MDSLFFFFLSSALFFRLFVPLPFPIFRTAVPMVSSSVGQNKTYKCYGKFRRRCVTARTESDRQSCTDMPCMQVKLGSSPAPTSTACTPIYKWERPHLSVVRATARKPHTSHRQPGSFIFVRFPITQTNGQGARYGNELDLEDELRWGQNWSGIFFFQLILKMMCPKKIGGHHLILRNAYNTQAETHMWTKTTTTVLNLQYQRGSA